LLQDNCSLLLGHDETQQLLNKLAVSNPKLVEELIPKKIPLSTLTQILQNLLQEGVPIRDLRTILLALSSVAEKVTAVEELTAVVRVALGRMIVQKFVQPGEELPIMTLAPELEQVLHNVVSRMNNGAVPIEPDLAEGLMRNVNQAAREEADADRAAVLVTSPTLRSWLSKVLRPRIQGLTVLSYAELPDDIGLRVNRSIAVQPRQVAATAA